MSVLSLKGQNLLTTEGMTIDDLRQIMISAHLARRRAENNFERGSNIKSGTLRGRRVFLAFFEPSTRTFESFSAAAQILGCHVSGFRSSAGTSTDKGESLPDTVRTVTSYNTDLLVIRHPQIGAAQVATDNCGIPVINAGDGTNQHPTQALLDVLCLLEHFGGFSRPDGINLDVLRDKTIAICGDLRNGRTLHSGIPLYRLLGMKLILCAPAELQIDPPDGIESTQVEKLEAALAGADIIYMTRIQFERPGMDQLQHLKGAYVLRRDMINDFNPEIAILHPLPRVDEIATDVDDLPNALYFKLQTPCGMWTRMALLELLIRDHTD